LEFTRPEFYPEKRSNELKMQACSRIAFSSQCKKIRENVIDKI